MTYKRYGGAND